MFTVWRTICLLLVKVQDLSSIILSSIILSHPLGCVLSRETEMDG